jgi:hypothetical protein
MPFTPAHAAAALPLRRTGLVFSALVIGCLTPDFEYFLLLGPRGIFGHTILGIFVLDLPLGLLVFWLFHRYLEPVLLEWFSNNPAPRANSSAGRFMFNWRTLGLTAISIVISAITHIIWDSFTHPNFWTYHHWLLLHQTLQLPVIGGVKYYKVLQHVSTVLGLLILFLWLKHLPSSHRFRFAQIPRPFWTILLIAFVGALLRAYIGVGWPRDFEDIKVFVAELVITAVTFTWVQLTLCGIIYTRRSAH